MKKVMKQIPILMAVTIMFLYSCNNKDEPMPEATYTDIMATQIKNDLVDDASIFPYAAIFDVSPAFDQGHLPFATNVGSVDALGNMLSGIDKTLTYLVYCHGDGPSMAGAQLMEDAGFKNVYRLEGNYGAWVNAGYSVEK